MEHTSTKWLLEKAFSVINPQKSQQSFDRKLTFCKMQNIICSGQLWFCLVWWGRGGGARGTWSHTVWWPAFGFVWYFTQTQQLRWGYLANACNLFNGFVFILIECSHIFKGTAKTASFNEKRSIISFYIKLNSNHPWSAFRKLKVHIRLKIKINPFSLSFPHHRRHHTVLYQANIFVKVSLSVTKTKFTEFRPKVLRLRKVFIIRTFLGSKALHQNAPLQPSQNQNCQLPMQCNGWFSL